MKTNDTSPDREIVNTRTVNAPRELVYAAWTDPEHLKHWWGPAGFTNTFTDFDLRPGGKWNFIMHGPDKDNYPNECEFTRIEEPGFISWKRLSKPLFEMAVSLEMVATDETRVVFKMIFPSAEACDKLKGFAPEKNEENLDRLELELAKMKLENK